MSSRSNILPRTISTVVRDTKDATDLESTFTYEDVSAKCTPCPPRWRGATLARTCRQFLSILKTLQTDQQTVLGPTLREVRHERILKRVQAARHPSFKMYSRKYDLSAIG